MSIDIEKERAEDERDALADLRKAVTDGASDEWLLAFIRGYPFAATQPAPIPALTRTEDDAGTLAGFLAQSVLEFPGFDCDNPDEPRPLCALANRVLTALDARPVEAPACPACPKDTPYGPATCFNCVKDSEARAGNALTDEAKDAARFRQAIAHEDNAELLYAAMLNHAPDADAIRREFDASHIKAGQAGKEE